MHPAMWIAKTGLDAQQTRISVISNNLANVNTNGFKKGRAVFEDLLYQNIRQPGGQSSQNTTLPSGLMLGMGVRTVATEKIFQEGSVINTNNSLDVAIDGKGFLQVLRPDGNLAYTRDGSLKMDSEGNLVTASGYQIQPTITVPEDAISLTIGSDGVVSAQTPGTATPTTLGNLDMAHFVNPTGLQPIGENQFIETAASGTPTVGTPGTDGLGSLVQNALESSNVNVAEELVNMIETQRAFEANSKAVDAVNSMLQFLNNTI